MDIGENTRKHLKDIREGRAKKEKIQQLLDNHYSKEIKKKAARTPQTRITRNAIHQMRYAAKKTSKIYGTCEVAGFCTGKGRNISEYHIFPDQICNSVGYYVHPSGLIKTRRFKNTIAFAHSHNIMSCEHSQIDYFSIEERAKETAKNFQRKVGNVKVPFYYALNIIFNEETSEAKPPSLEICVNYPKIVNGNLEYSEVKSFKRKLKVVKGDVKRARKRLETEVLSNIRFDNNVYRYINRKIHNLY